MKLAILSMIFALSLTVPTYTSKNTTEQFNDIFHYQMNNLDGFDSVNEQNNLISSGTHQLTTDENGAANEAITFDGDGGYKRSGELTVPTNAIFEVNFKISSTLTDLSILIAKADYASNATRDFALGVGKEGNKYYIVLNVFNTSINTWSSISDYLEADTYHNARIEFVDKNVSLFLNDSLLGSVSIKSRNTSTTPFIIGYGINSNTSTPTSYQAFKGVISDVSLKEGKYDRDNMKNKVCPNPALRYSFERSSGEIIVDNSNHNHHGALYPAYNKATATSSKMVSGIENNALYLNGNNIVKTNYVVDSNKDFTISILFKIDEIPTGTRTLFAQVNTGLNQRELAVSITEKSLLITEIRIGDAWSGSRAVAHVVPNKWYQYTLVSSGDYIYNYIDGFLATVRHVPNRVTNTGASLLIGGSLNNETITQSLKCTVDEFVVYDKALNKEEVYSLIPNQIEALERSNVSIINESLYENVHHVKNVEFVAMQESILSGYKWQHGVSMTYFKDRFYATWGRNTGSENTVGEQAVIYSSEDARSWSYHSEVSAGTTMAYSHGVIFPIEDELYLMLPYYAGSDGISHTGIRFRNLHMHGFKLNSAGGWDNLGFSLPDFWPLQQPIKMKNGNYIMAGINTMWSASVAISNGDDLTDWKVVNIPHYGTSFTESNIIVEDNKITIYMRNENPYDVNTFTAGVSYSYDYGETWDIAQESDLHFYASKPAAGILSDGTKYLIGNSLKGAGRSRMALTIALENNGVFDEQYIIRSSNVPENLKDTYNARASFNSQATSYPSTFEKDGYLYVCYSSDMFGHNFNNIELAIIDLDDLYAYRYAEQFIKEHQTSSPLEIIASFNALTSESMKSALVESGFIATQMQSIDNIDYATEKDYVVKAVNTMLDIINNSSVDTYEIDKLAVKDIFDSLSSHQKGLIAYDAFIKIQSFIS